MELAVNKSSLKKPISHLIIYTSAISTVSVAA